MSCQLFFRTAACSTPSAFACHVCEITSISFQNRFRLSWQRKRASRRRPLHKLLIGRKQKTRNKRNIFRYKKSQHSVNILCLSKPCFTILHPGALDVLFSLWISLLLKWIRRAFRCKFNKHFICRLFCLCCVYMLNSVLRTYNMYWIICICSVDRRMWIYARQC